MAARSRSTEATTKPRATRNAKTPKTPTKPTKKSAGEHRVDVCGVSISHPDRVLYPGDGITKLDVARYYESIAKWIVPHVHGRPLTLVRCPTGIGDCAYMRHARVWGPSALRRIAIREKTKVGEYLVADSIGAVIGLAQMDILEIHTWNSTDDALEKPDRVVIDLDPDPTVEWPRVVEAAHAVRRGLSALGHDSFVKTTGGKGLHVVVPLVPKAGWDACFAFTRELAQALVRADPSRFVATMSKEKRHGKIFVDYLRNNRGNTSIAAYSTRARAGAPVSVPVTWRELDEEAAARGWTLRTLPARLAKLRKDPWAGYEEARRVLRP